MCHLCSLQDDEDDGGAAGPRPRLRRAKTIDHATHRAAKAGAASRLSRNYIGPFRKTPDRLFGMGLIRLYQLTLSGFIGNSCRHIPTCSEYGYEAIARHGLWAGGWMTLFRVGRCGPGGTTGLDPVPERLEPRLRWWAPWRYFRLGRKAA